VSELRRTPAIDLPAATARAAGGVSLRPLEDIGKLRLQVRRAGVDVAALGRALGTEPLPQTPLGAVTGAPAVFWTAPNEWLIAGAGLDVDDCARRLAPLLAEHTHALTDLSDGLAVIEIAGAGVLPLLAAVCSVDFDGAAGAPGRYTLTRMHRLPVLVHRRGAGDSFHLYVERTVARFVYEWLCRIAATVGKLPS
jgi:heterotetrameric sarcosine oxidase gamma subunit